MPRLFVIGSLNCRMTGIPTPYTERYPSKIWVRNVCEGAKVRNELRTEAGFPFVSTAQATTV
jgi:hypothetical protein